MSTLKIHVWAFQPDRTIAPDFRHVALETELQGKKIYISFWGAKEHLVSHVCFQEEPHFHTSNALDNECLSECRPFSYELTSLNVVKIQKAYRAYKKDPTTWGALGWGILSHIYQPTNEGVTAYLLDKGGLFKRFSSREEAFSFMLKTGAIANVFFTIVNAYYYFELKNDNDADNLPDFVGSLKHALKITKKNATEISKDPRFSEEGKALLEGVEKIKDEFFLLRLTKKYPPILVKDMQDEFRRKNWQIGAASAGLLGVSVLLLYVNNRYIAEKPKRRDLVVLTQELEKAEKKKQPVEVPLTNKKKPNYTVLGVVSGTGLILLLMNVFKNSHQA